MLVGDKKEAMIATLSVDVEHENVLHTATSTPEHPLRHYVMPTSRLFQK